MSRSKRAPPHRTRQKPAAHPPPRSVNACRRDACEQRANTGGRSSEPEHQRHNGEDAQHRAEDRAARSGRLVASAAFPHHTAHAVFCFKRLFFKEVKLLRLRPAGEKDPHRGGDQHQQHAHAKILRHTAADYHIPIEKAALALRRFAALLAAEGYLTMAG